MNTFIILILLTLWVAACAICFTLGTFWGQRREKPRTTTALSEEEKRILEREKRELENFWTYTGDRQN